MVDGALLGKPPPPRERQEALRIPPPAAAVGVMLREPPLPVGVRSKGCTCCFGVLLRLFDFALIFVFSGAKSLLELFPFNLLAVPLRLICC